MATSAARDGKEIRENPEIIIPIKRRKKIIFPPIPKYMEEEDDYRINFRDEMMGKLNLFQKRWKGNGRDILRNDLIIARDIILKDLQNFDWENFDKDIIKEEIEFSLNVIKSLVNFNIFGVDEA